MAMSADEILAAMSALIEQATASGEPMSDEDVARYEQLEASLKAVQKSQELVKRNAAYNALKPAGVAVAAKVDDADEITRAFDAYLRTGDRDLIVRAQSEGVASAGGYLVPEGFRQKMVERRKAFGGIAANCETITTDSGNPLPWPVNDDTANVGGITAEGASMPTSGGADLVFATRTLGAFKYSSGGASNLPLKVSYELAQDSAFPLADFVARRLGERIARGQAPHWATGNGVGQPQGLLSTGGGISAATAWSSNTAPTYDDLVTTVHDLDPDYREGAVWVFNDAVLEIIRKMEDGNNRPLLLPAGTGNLGDSLAGMTLLGYRVIVDQACPSPSASNNFGFFGRLQDAYVIRRVKATTMVTLNELYAVNGQVGYLAWERADGCVQDPYAGVLLRAAA